uniref:Uncharacterized protein n=1 Tax=Branchiostoma floridae TaxID=7739 RepID=C3ZTT8_BRAFL|eukprot:XP_002588075.1 hypothetical protein BRAFLDRAFT_83075 [Branchiostoma floridae]
MPPKRAKSGGGSAGLAKWEQALLEAQFEEEEWKPNVTLVVGNKMEDYRHVDALHAVVGIPQRKLFSTVSKADLFEQVKELGNPKAKKGKETPQFYEICESVKPMLDEGLDVPILVLAKLIKFKLLDIKVNDLKRREAEKKKCLDIFLKAAEDKAKGKTPGKDGKRPRSKSPAKGKGKKTPEPPAVKKDTKLKRRGEEDEENKYIDDEPDDGPQHYMLVHGFHQPQLVMALADVGVNVDALLKITSEDYTIFQTPNSGGGEGSPREEQKKDEQVEPVAGAQEAQQDIERQQRQKAEDELKRFWKFLDPVLRRAPAGSRLHDMARLEYVVVNTLHPSDWEDPDKTLSAQAPTPGIPELDVPAGLPDVDMRYYSELMNTVPQESVSIPLIMHCMLEQVSATEEDREPPSERPVPPRQDGVDPNLAAHMGGAAVKLALSEEEQMALDGELDLAAKPVEDKNQQRPLLLQYGDGVSLRTHHLKQVDGFQPQVQELKMVHLLPVARLCELPPPSTRVSKERAARLQELLHFCATGKEQSLSQERPDENKAQEESKEAEHKSQEEQEEEDQSDHVTVNLIEATQKRQLDDWCFAEHFEPEVLIQLLPQARPFHDDGVPQPPGSLIYTTTQPGTLTSTLMWASGKEQSLSQEIPDENKAQEESKEAEHKSQEEQEEEDQSDHVTVNLIEATQKRQLDDWCFAEHFEPEVLIQVLDEAKFKYSHMDSYYHKRDHSMMMVFHNPLGPDLHNHTAWNTYLHSDVGFRLVHNHTAWNTYLHSDVGFRLVHKHTAWNTYLHSDVGFRLVHNHTAWNTYLHSDVGFRLVHNHTAWNTYLHSDVGFRLVHNHTAWNTYLHSDVGFRNYLEHVTENISDWVRVEEAKFQAELLAKELALQKTPVTTPDTSRPSSSKSQRKRSQSPKKKSRSPSGKRSKRGSAKSPERPSSAARPLHVRENSLKAWKEEQDILKAEEERKAREKEEKRAKSASKKASRERGSSAGSTKSKSREKTSDKKSRGEDKEDKDKTQEPVPEIQEPTEPEVILPFTGYDVGNELVHAAGESVTLFPCDGGIIRTEKNSFVQDGVAVRTSVLKDGHLFVIHILDPRQKGDVDNTGEESVKEKADLEKSEKEEGSQSPRAGTPDKKDESAPLPLSRFGSFTAVLKDGMCLSLSNHGPSGKPKMPGGAPTRARGLKKRPSPPSSSCLCPVQMDSTLGIKPETVAEIGRSRLLVRQTYPFKTRGLQKVEDLRKKPAMQEVSRCVNSDGTVVKVLHDGSTQEFLQEFLQEAFFLQEFLQEEIFLQEC